MQRPVWELPFGDALEEPIDAAVESLPGWTSTTERRFNHWYARTAYQGRGAMVDLGCMTGSSTRALAEGLRLNPRVSKDALIHAYDVFEKYWDSIPGEPLADVPTGASFLAEFERNLAGCLDRVRVHAGDIRELGWSEDPIEFLFVDVMKSWDLTSHTAIGFFPSVQPGLGLVVHQDFKNFYTPWINILMYRLRDSFRPVFDIPRAEATVFACVEPVSADECRRACLWDDLTQSEVNDVFRYSRKAVLDGHRAFVTATEATLYAHLAGLIDADTARPSNIEQPATRAVRTLARIHPRWDRTFTVGEPWRLLRPHIEKHPMRFAMPLLRRRIRSISGRVASRMVRIAGRTGTDG